MGRSLRITLIALFLIVALIFGLTLGRQVFLANSEPTPAPDLSEYNTYVYEQPRELVEFTLTDEQGNTVTREDLKGRWSFVFVGYT
ncbi:MAG: SCO family protein, partial [Marinobacter sp.]